MRGFWLISAIAVAGCAPGAPAPGNKAEPAPTPVPSPTPAPSASPSAQGDLAAWLVGGWSFDKDCATDFSVHYHPDGMLQSIGDTGRWSASGDTVTETITERGEMGEEAPETLNPPEVRSYTVERTDRRHAVLHYQGKAIPILRC